MGQKRELWGRARNPETMHVLSSGTGTRRADPASDHREHPVRQAERVCSLSNHAVPGLRQHGGSADAGQQERLGGAQGVLALHPGERLQDGDS